jgi:hypothetical protein
MVDHSDVWVLAKTARNYSDRWSRRTRFLRLVVMPGFRQSYAGLAIWLICHDAFAKRKQELSCCIRCVRLRIARRFTMVNTSPDANDFSLRQGGIVAIADSGERAAFVRICRHHCPPVVACCERHGGPSRAASEVAPGCDGESCSRCRLHALVIGPAWVADLRCV